MDPNTGIAGASDLDRENYGVIAKSENEFSIENDAGDTQSLGPDKSYQWTTGGVEQSQSFTVNDDGSFVRRNADTSATTRDEDGNFTLRGADGVILQNESDGTWSVNGEPANGENILGKLGVSGRISDNGTFDIRHSDGTREFVTEDGTYGYQDANGNTLQVDGEGGGFIHEDVDGNSLWKTEDGDVGQTLGSYSGFQNVKGENQIGSYVPYAGERDGFVNDFNPNASAGGEDIDDGGTRPNDVVELEPDTDATLDEGSEIVNDNAITSRGGAADGSDVTLYADGSGFGVSENGDITVMNSQGEYTTYDAETGVRQSQVGDSADNEIVGRSASGDGASSTQYADGSSFEVDADGDVTLTNPLGIYERYEFDTGERVTGITDGAGTTQWTNGATDQLGNTDTGFEFADGSALRFDADGDVFSRDADGTVAWLKEDGTSGVAYPDGTTTINQRNYRLPVELSPVPELSDPEFFEGNLAPESVDSTQFDNWFFSRKS